MDVLKAMPTIWLVSAAMGLLLRITLELGRWLRWLLR